MKDGATDAGLAQVEAAWNALLDEAKAGRRGVALISCWPPCDIQTDIADFDENGDADHGDHTLHVDLAGIGVTVSPDSGPAVPDFSAGEGSGQLRLHELEGCWCGSRHVMRLASEIGWDTSVLGDRLIMCDVEKDGQQ